MVQVATITQRQEFIDLTKAGARWVTPAFVVQYLPKKEGEQGFDGIKVGFTATKKIGNAVRRNRAKRRLRAVFDDVVRLDRGFPCVEGRLVLIARQDVLGRDFAALQKDFKWALKKLGVVHA